MGEYMAKKIKNQDARLDVRLPADMVIQAKRKAQRQKRTLSDIVRELLRDWLGK
jgi:Ribbon-helix-helix protein, copG family